MFRGMNLDQRTVLKALDERMSAKKLHERLQDRFEKNRIQGLLRTLQWRGLIDHRSGEWYRTLAGERVVEKHRD